MGEKVETARRALVEARRAVRTEKVENPTSDPPRHPSVAALAAEYHDAARKWNAQALAYWEAKSNAPILASETAADPLRHEREQADSILRAAAQALSEATSEARRENPKAGTTSPAQTTTEADPIAHAFSLVLAWERKVLDKLAVGDAADRTVELCEAQYHLALRRKSAVRESGHDP